MNAQQKAYAEALLEQNRALNQRSKNAIPKHVW
jgi:hypothetical protein